MIEVDSEAVEGNWHRWMTLGQIKELLKIDNLVNMDTRTVMSCLSLYQAIQISPDLFHDQALYWSLYQSDQPAWAKFFHPLNDTKMFDSAERSIVPLPQLKGWECTDESSLS